MASQLSPRRERIPSAPVSVAPLGGAPASVAPGERSLVLVILVSGLSAVVGVLIPGTLLAVVGWFRPVVVLPAAVATSVVLYRWLMRRPASVEHLSPLRTKAAVAVLVFAALWAVFHGARPSHHVLTDRDPAVYATTGRWLARDGDLVVEGRTGPFADRDLGVATQGYTDVTADGDVRPQFLHGWPVLLAVGQWIGGDRLMFRMPALVGALSLVALYALAATKLRPWFAFGATVALGVSLPMLYVARDVFTEAATQLLLLGGTWALIWAGRDRTGRRAAAAALVLGASMLLRIDAVLYVAALPPYLAFEWLRSRSDGGATRFAAVTAGATLAIGALAALDGLARAPDYVHDLRAEVLGQLAVVALSAVASLVAVVAIHRGWRPTPPGRRSVANAAALLVLLLAGVAALRPILQSTSGRDLPLIEAIQHDQGQSIDGTQRYAEHSFSWLTWYVGWLSVVAALGACAAAVRDVILGRRTVPVLVLLGFVIVTTVYLWRPSAVPDHLWVMRRFVPVTLPGIALLSFVAAQSLWDARAKVGRLAGAAIFTAAVAVPLATVAPVVRARTQTGYAMAITDACDVMGEDAAVIVPEVLGFDRMYPAAIRSWCGVPVATAPEGFATGRYAALADAWRREGRTLWVLGAPGPEVSAISEPGTVIERTNDAELEKTLTEAPDELGPDVMRFQIGAVRS
jgi:hypothetical protein